MTLSPNAQFHADQAAAALDSGDPDEALGHYRQLVEDGTPEDHRTFTGAALDAAAELGRTDRP
ncbi:hypothetical protein [Streptomyces sp. NPDC047525]|uniref:hypothetical protein n=1 Tax=Streptomyces sp. NPDC047525 TaxID=3155264 RepID=UPI0033E80ACF